jgi:hypothetical protein
MPYGKGGKNKVKNNRLAIGDKKIDRKRKCVASKSIKTQTAQAETKALAKAEADSSVSDSAASSEDNDNSEAKKRVKMTMKERADSGLVVISQEEKRIYIKVAYAIRYEEPEPCEWSQIAGDLMRETCMRRETIIEIFNKCQSGVPHPEQQTQGCGRPVKLERDNKGLIAAAVAINIGVPPAQATEICNMHNAMESPSITVCRNTLMSTIQRYTDVDMSAVERRKTGSKDPTGAWAVARAVMSTQMAGQFDYGDRLDSGTAVFDCDLPPPLSACCCRARSSIAGPPAGTPSDRRPPRDSAASLPPNACEQKRSKKSQPQVLLHSSPEFESRRKMVMGALPVGDLGERGVLERAR